MSLNQMGMGFVFTAEDLASGVIGRIDQGFQRLEGSSAAAASAMRANLAQLGQGAAIAGVGLAGLAALERALGVSSEFSAAIAEVSTLVDEATFSTADLTRTTLELTTTYGGEATGQARALYETISAGITDAAKATDLLRVANELAIGGVTETKTAVDALTNVVNAYAQTGARARDVSDAFFVAIKAGKTTAAELAATIGRVAPTAVALGVSFSDLLAGIAAVTGQGLDTAEAVTGMKAALANVIKPTSDAVKEATRLGIKFDAAALRAKGLRGFLDSITSSARFNADTMSKLFGSVEALNAVIALTSNNSAVFNAVLDQMASRGGATKAAFDKMAGTLSFQEKRFEAVKKAALIVIGQALEPIEDAIVRVKAAVLEAFLRIPAPIREFAVRAFAAVSVVLVLLGTFIAAKAAIALLVLGLKALGITLGSVVVALLPVIAAFVALALVVTGFVVAFRRDVGGIATFFERVVERVKLLARGLVQVFSDGGFSGAVMDELNKAENAGVKQFAIRVYQIVFRLQRFFEGVADGFRVGIEAVQPVFTKFVSSLRELGEAFGIVGTESADALAAIGSDRYARAGASLGDVLARVVAIIVDALAAIVRIGGGIVRGLRDAIAYFRPTFEFVATTIQYLGDMITSLSNDLAGADDQTKATTSAWTYLGRALGWIAGLLATTVAAAIGVVAFLLGGLVDIVRMVINAFSDYGTYLRDTGTKIYRFFGEDVPRVAKAAASAVKAYLQPVFDFIGNIVDGIQSALNRVVAFVGRLVAKIPARFRPAFLDSIVEAGQAAQEQIAARTAKAIAPMAVQLAPGGGAVAVVPAAASSGPSVGIGAIAAASSLPAASELRARSQISDAQLDAIVARGIQLSDDRPVQAHVTLNVDGETLARASAKASRSTAARAFHPVPIGGEP